MTVITTIIHGDKISSHVHVSEEVTSPAERIYGTMLIAAIDGTIEVIGNDNSPLKSVVGQLLDAFRKTMTTREHEGTERNQSH